MRSVQHACVRARRPTPYWVLYTLHSIYQTLEYSIEYTYPPPHRVTAQRCAYAAPAATAD
jgi:hypothetical protein